MEKHKLMYIIHIHSMLINVYSSVSYIYIANTDKRALLSYLVLTVLVDATGRAERIIIIKKKIK